jgi:phytoene dehydrogenase-like protein
MNLSMFAGSAFFAQYKNELIAHGLALLPAVDCFASVFRDNTYLGVSTDLEKTARAIGALSPEDALAWRTLLAEFHADAPYIFGLLGSPMPSWAAVKVIWNAWRAKGPGWLYDTARLLFASPRNFLDARFQNTKLKTMMAAWGLHLDFAPDVAGGALFPYLESMTSQAFGMMIGQGGADTIIKAMTGLLRAKGGELLLGSPVEKIDVTNGKASGVRLANGQCIKAARAVIANVHPKILIERLVPADPQRAVFDRKVQKFRASPVR